MSNVSLNFKLPGFWTLLTLNILKTKHIMKNLLFFSLVFTVGITLSSFAQISYPGEDAGKAVVKIIKKSQIIMSNNTLNFELENNGENILIKSFEGKNTQDQLKLTDHTLFELILEDNSIINSNEFMMVNSPVISDINGDPGSETYVNRLGGKKYSVDLINKQLKLNVHWEAHLRDGSNYVRQIFKFSSDDTIQLSNITLIQLPLSTGIRQAGVLDGLPMICKNMFFAIEYPLSKIELHDTDLIATLPRLTPITPSNSFTVSSVWGTTPVGQLRRGFLFYIERERGAPYHQMSFYNSWGDIAWSDRKMSERSCIDRIKWFGDSLIVKRDVQLTAFLFDDGWDDNKTLWQFHSGFPDGFTNLKKVAESYGSTLGVWISPFGGYASAKQQRLEYGKKQDPPFETNRRGFSLAGPVYYKRFKDVLVDFIMKYDVSMLKFDGVAGSYRKEMEAYLKVTKELREIKPDLYFCLTTGTWASPFFLKYGDCVWRGGGDYGYTGVGSNRQRWITYRDAEVYKNVIKPSPLFPLSALQNMGIFICDIGRFGEFEMNEKDISDDIWTAIATGTAVQGQYINPIRMNSKSWDCLANALKWAKRNEGVMVDMHWVGGDPAKGDVYGFAAWSPEKAVLTLRNPSREVKSFNINVATVFELPAGTKNYYLFYDAKKNSSPYADQPMVQGNSFEIILKPLEVKVLDAFPEKN